MNTRCDTRPNSSSSSDSSLLGQSRLDGLTSSGTLRFGARARELREQGRHIYSLGLGEPRIATPDHIIEATYAAMKDGLTRYSSSPGLPELRQAIKEKLFAENGLNYEIDEIVVTPGAKAALHLTLSALARVGDEVVNLVPAYVSYEPLAHLAGPGVRVKNVPLRTVDHRLDEEALDEALSPRTRLILYNSPHNPTGRVFSRSDIEALAQRCVERDILLVSDEVYEALNYGNIPHISPATLPGMRERTIVVNGFGKAFAMTGWRIGYMAAPQRLLDGVLKMHSHTNTNTCTFVQMGALAALRGPQDHLLALCEALRRNRDYLMTALAKQSLLSVSPPDGGLFAFADIRKTGLPSEEVCVRLLEETGVAITPGGAFGAEGFARISLANTEEETRAGINRLVALIQEWNRERS
jgi:aspartate aminotransferase